MYVHLYSKLPPAPCIPREARPMQGGCARADRDGALTNTFSDRTVAVPPPQGPGEDAFSVHLARFVPEGL